MKYYIAGAIALGVFWLFSGLIAKKWNPFHLAKGEKEILGENEKYSASLLQMIIFTMLTIFAYTTVFAARMFEKDGAGLLPSLKDGDTWLGVPSNLLMLMGISVGTAVASRAIKVNQAENGTLPPNDNSSLTTYRDGKTDLVKIQMLIWTAIAVFVYLQILWTYMNNHCYLPLDLLPKDTVCQKEWGNSLPDIDTAFLALLGISQAGQVVNQLSEKTAQKLATIAKIVVAPASVTLPAGNSTQLTATITDAQGKTISDLPEGSLEWASEDKTKAEVDQKGLVTHKATGKCNITATANKIVSNKCEVTCQ